MSSERDSPETPEIGPITVEFLDDEIVLTPGSSLTFGRRADLIIDDNPFLHRVIGRVASREGIWWLQNHGTRTVLELRDSDSDYLSKIPPSQQIPITSLEMVLTFSAGPSNYELVFRQAHAISTGLDGDERSGTATIDFGVIPFTTDQHLLLVALCENRLLGDSTLPPNRAIARTVGWTLTKYNRKLDAVCAKLSRQGVRGLRGSNDALASDRRINLVEHAVSAGLVTKGDLGLLRGIREAPPVPSD